MHVTFPCPHHNVCTADPYVTLTYSRLEKPLYSTRIIKGDCNPVFEETAVLLVDLNTVKLREKLSFQLWDSDRMSVVRSLSPSPSDCILTETILVGRHDGIR